MVRAGGDVLAFAPRLQSAVAVRILRCLEQHPEGLSDHALAAALPPLTRTHVNSVCHRLARRGLVERRQGADVILNHLTVDADE